MRLPLPRLIRELTIRLRHRSALRKVRVIESLDIPEDLKLAAARRVMRQFEEALERFV